MKQSKFFDKVLPNMSLNNVETVINCFSDHLSVYVGRIGNAQQSAEIAWTNKNGFGLDLWTDSAESDQNLYDQGFWRYGIQREILTRYFEFDVDRMRADEVNDLFERVMGFAKARAAKLKGAE